MPTFRERTTRAAWAPALALFAALVAQGAQAAGATGCDVASASAQRAEPPLQVKVDGARTFIGLTAQQFGMPMMWSTRTESATLGAGFNGLPVGDRLVQFERSGDRVELRMLSTLRQGDAQTRDAARMSDSPRLVAKLEASAGDASGVVWVNVTPLVLGFGPESDGDRWWEFFLGLLSAPMLNDGLSRAIDARGRPGAAQFRAELSFAITARLPSAPGSPERGSDESAGRSQTSMIVLHSFMVLPADAPMVARQADPRVGFLSVSRQRFLSDFRGEQPLSYIARHRLEPRCADEKPAVPKRRITFYMAPEVPETWRPAIRAGILDWAGPLQSAGFTQAIEVSESPPEPDWNPADPRFNTIRWVAQPISNAIGKPVIDPRTGEILSSTLILWSGVLAHFGDQYRASVADADPRNEQADNAVLNQELLRYVMTHETGHALGLSHNHKAATAYPLAWLRDPELTRRFGTSASIMSYGRFNHVANRQDGITSFIPKIGPYDHFAVRWGYSPEAVDAGEALDPGHPVLRAHIQRLLEFGGDEAAADLDPQHLAENIGDDRIASTKAGLARLSWTWQRVATLPANTPAALADLRRQYHEAMQQRSHLLRGLVKVIGGVVETRRAALAHGALYTPQPPSAQQEALLLLLRTLGDDEAHAEITRAAARLQPAGAHVALVNAYKLVLSDLLLPQRLSRLRGQPGDGVTVGGLLGKLQDTLFAAGPQATLSPVRLELQSMYLARLRALLTEVQIVPVVAAGGLSGEQPSHALDLGIEARGAMQELLALSRRAARQHPRSETRRHYQALAAALMAALERT